MVVLLFPIVYTYTLYIQTWLGANSKPIVWKEKDFSYCFRSQKINFLLNKEKKAKSLYPFTTYISFVIFNGVEYILLYFRCFTYGICTRIQPDRHSVLYISQNFWTTECLSQMPQLNWWVLGVRHSFCSFSFFFVYYWDIDEKEDLCQIEQKMEQ